MHPLPMSLDQAIVDGQRLLIEATERMMRTLVLGASMAAKLGAKREKREAALAW